MRTAVLGVNIVRERHDALVVAVVVLHGDLRDGIALLAAHIDDVTDGFVALDLVDMLDKLPDTALIVQNLGNRLILVALVGHDDADAGIEERLLAHTL